MCRHFSSTDFEKVNVPLDICSTALTIPLHISEASVCLNFNKHNVILKIVEAISFSGCGTCMCFKILQTFPNLKVKLV